MITYISDLTRISADSLRGGFFAGWPHPPTPETHLRVLQGSTHVVLALAGERIVGYITAMSDGVLAAYIPHLEVLAAWRNQGIGRELVRRMLERLQTLYMIDLICDADLQPFYAHSGMRPYTGMIVRNYDRQDGAPALPSEEPA